MMKFLFFISMVGPSPQFPDVIIASILGVFFGILWYGLLFGGFSKKKKEIEYKQPKNLLWSVVKVLLALFSLMFIAYYINLDLIYAHLNTNPFGSRHYDDSHHWIIGSDLNKFIHGAIHGAEFSVVRIIPIFIILS